MGTGGPSRFAIRCSTGARTTIVAVVAAVTLIGSTASALGATIYPTRSDDPSGSGHCPSNCSLRQAVAFAKSGDTISLAPPAPQRTYVLTQGELSVAKPLTIAGVSARQSAITAPTGTIVAASGHGVTLARVDLTGIESGGGVALNVSGPTILVDSSVSDNPGAGALEVSSSTLNIVSSTVAGNGGIGIAAAGSTIDLSNSTIANNYGVLGLSLAGDATTIASTTIADNGNSSSGIGNVSAAGGAISFRDSIVAAGLGSPGNCAFASVAETATYSIEDQDQCGFSGTTDHPNTTPQLLGLADYGGPTNTMALSSTSPAVNTGDPTGCASTAGKLLLTDERGAARSGRCDIGAFEYQPPPKNTARPSVSGTARAGSAVTCGLGKWSGGRPLTFTVRWLNNGSPVKGATRDRYTIPADAAGHSLACSVTAANFAANATATSVRVTVRRRKR
jgi:hypothetical protein